MKFLEWFKGGDVEKLQEQVAEKPFLSKPLTLEQLEILNAGMDLMERLARLSDQEQLDGDVGVLIRAYYHYSIQLTEENSKLEGWDDYR